MVCGRMLVAGVASPSSHVLDRFAKIGRLLAVNAFFGWLCLLNGGSRSQERLIFIVNVFRSKRILLQEIIFYFISFHVDIINIKNQQLLLNNQQKYRTIRTEYIS
jgi:hypothetical protein